MYRVIGFSVDTNMPRFVSSVQKHTTITKHLEIGKGEQRKQDEDDENKKTVPQTPLLRIINEVDA